MSQEQNNNNTTPVDEKLTANEQSGWASGNFPTIDLNFDIDENEINDALKKEKKKRGHGHGKGKKGEHHDHDGDCDHDHDHDHEHEHDGDCCGPMLKKEDITEEMLKNAQETYDAAVNTYNEGDYMTSSEMFSEAVTVLAPYYGDEDIKLVDIYYYYGDSILNLARQKILSSIVIDLDEGEEDNIISNIHLNKKKNALKDTISKIEEVDDDENVIELLKGDGGDDGDDDFDDLDDEDFFAELEDEVADDLEVAWDVLEMARALITQKSGDNIDEEKLSNIHLSLGSVAVESDQIDIAIKEYEECISLRKKVLGDRHRKTAEAYYMLAMAFCSSPEGKIEQAIEKLTETQSILEENLKVAEEKKNEVEIIELSDLLDEVKLRVEDLKDPNFQLGSPHLGLIEDDEDN